MAPDDTTPTQPKEEARRDEDEAERLDRELIELLNELRVVMPGVQVLFGFLLTVPFQQRFSVVTDFQKDVYFVTLLLTAVSIAFLLGPSAFHRLTFRHGQKPYLIRLGTRQTIAGLVFLALALVLVVLLHFTRFGRAVFLSGQSESAARFAGIPVGRVQTITYVITGISAAIAGLVMSAYFGSARVDLGSATLLPAVTAAVLGGASIYGGQGSILGTLIATFVIGYLQQGLQAAGVPSQISSALSGGLLVVAVALRHASAMLADFIAVARQKRQNRAAVTSGGE